MLTGQTNFSSVMSRFLTGQNIENTYFEEFLYEASYAQKGVDKEHIITKSIT